MVVCSGKTDGLPVAVVPKEGELVLFERHHRGRREEGLISVLLLNPSVSPLGPSDKDQGTFSADNE